MSYRRCGYCGGTGQVECECTGGCGPSAADGSCYACGGRGYHTCPACSGRGEVEDDDY